MVRCNITARGTISRDASMHTTKEDETFLTFPLRIVIQGKDGRNEAVEISVNKGGAQKKVSSYRGGLRVEVAGTLFPKRRDEELYLSLFADRIATAKGIADSIRGELSFRSRVGKNIEEREDKKDKSYTMFSTSSTEKVDKNLECQWACFSCFDRQRKEWLQPSVKVEAKGELAISAHNGKPDISCRVGELTQYVPESDNSSR